MAATPAPVDPNVKMPPGVAAQVARVDALHKAAYQPVTEPVTDPPQPPPQEPPEPAPQPEPAPEPAPQPEPAPTPPPEPPKAKKGETVGTAEEEHQKFLSMQGRYASQQKTMGGMQEQLQQLADELIRTQSVLAQKGQGAQPQPQAPRRGITPKDVEAYGEDLVDLARRAAVDALSPEIEAIKARNQLLEQQLGNTTSRTVHQTLDATIPNWREINASTEFKAWCALRDIYSGQVRGRMLNAAFRNGEATRVIAFFRGFLSEAATGNPPDPQPQPAPTPPRQAAIPLVNLAAPGRDQPAPGNSQPAGEKPIYRRADVAKFYDDVRKGVYEGRKADKDAFEQSIFAAQREGRVKG